MDILDRGFREASRRQRLRYVIVAGRSEGKPTTPSPAEVHAVAREAAKAKHRFVGLRNRLLFDLAYETGLRSMSLLALSGEDIRVVRGRCWLHVRDKGREGQRPVEILSIKHQFDEVLRGQPPHEAWFERPGGWQRRGGTQTESVELLAMSRAAMLIACAEPGVEPHEVYVHQVRLKICGRTNARKLEVCDVLRALGFDLPTRPPGAPDLDIANAALTAVYARSEGTALGGQSTPLLGVK